MTAARVMTVADLTESWEEFIFVSCPSAMLQDNFFFWVSVLSF